MSTPPRRPRRSPTACAIPPRGHRSVGGGQAQFDYAPMKMADMTRRSDDNTLITVMIETPKAVRNAEAIAAVPGIDALLVGSSDLSMEMGIPGENGHPRIQEAVDKVIAACKKHRKWPGMGGALQRGAAAALHRQGHEAAARRQRLCPCSPTPPARTRPKVRAFSKTERSEKK